MKLQTTMLFLFLIMVCMDALTGVKSKAEARWAKQHNNGRSLRKWSKKASVDEEHDRSSEIKRWPWHNRKNTINFGKEHDRSSEIKRWPWHNRKNTINLGKGELEAN
ncbi:uncharacterized protein [Montipora capricornis]|uniref:uncharacterized protein n=1 Tax=Montipora capricornis TaxID=246305 RepID=UPI0035F12AEE